MKSENGKKKVEHIPSFVGLSCAFGMPEILPRKVTFSRSTMKYLTVRSSLRSIPVSRPSMQTVLPFEGSGLTFQRGVLGKWHFTGKMLLVALVAEMYCSAWISKVLSSFSIFAGRHL